MNNIAASIKSSMMRIQTAVHKKKYDVAAGACEDLLRLGYDCEGKVEVFIGEALQSTYMHLNRDLNNFNIPAAQVTQLENDMDTLIDELIDTYENQKDVCPILMNVRHQATKFQFDGAFINDRRSNKIHLGRD